MAAIVHFFHEVLGDGTVDHVVRSEYRSLEGHSDQRIVGGIADAIAALGEWKECNTCADAGLVVDVSLTGNYEVYHYIDGFSSRVGMLFSVTERPQKQLQQLIVLKFALTRSALIAQADISEAVDRSDRWKQSQGSKP